MVIFHVFEPQTRNSIHSNSIHFVHILVLVYINTCVYQYIAISNIFWRTHESAGWLLILILLCMVTSAWYFKPYNFDSVNFFYIFIMYYIQWHSNTYTYDSVSGYFYVQKFIVVDAGTRTHAYNVYSYI